ncbi:hypothetical protein PRIPAC_76520 [Pristionchus pacificus]|uniref:Protein kinase domain-containing protein n=1 Tax=Pristionchus pacificus TaxID=54126 RepID=A0A2A6BWG0_PRIPA|nr:hypothetical protein PRIPAC_76520 [Pristionchus pacificus]|eukprot:PDM70229.1 protein kinase [Pristionchus pacificus]
MLVMSDERASCEREEDEEWDDRLPGKNQMIRGKDAAYSIGKMINRGRFGAIYEVLRKRDGKRFAAKLEVCETHSHGIDMDYSVLKKASKEEGREMMPSLIDRGKIADHFRFIIITLMGHDMWRLRTELTEEGRFSLSTSLRLALLTLHPIEYLHSMGYIHRDIKASNFVLSADGCNVCIIDFGLCRHYKDKEGDLKAPREISQFRGTTRYASLSAHRNLDQSPKDDIESWLYMIIEFISGFLPWSHFNRKERDEVMKMKENARSSEGMHDLLKYSPTSEFRRILKYIDGLSFDSHVDYTYLGQLIGLSMRNHDVNVDEPFDWQEN